MVLSPVTLNGNLVTLEPLTLGHTDSLAAVGLHPSLWTLQPRPITSIADMRAYVELALNEQARGASLPFAVVHRATKVVIGSTRFFDIALPHGRLEIGATWYPPSVQRTGVNVESKLLLLTHAFEELGIQKVVLKTETLNQKSRTAILALGAQEEGTFARQFLADDGRKRDMVYFAIFDDMWPSVKARLRERLRRGRQA
ncbi:MAG TPA: GNAT family protein [Gemmatimonadales bacterium]|nr:GNAT family protein [Gemmatimonadales bacterium]